MLDQALLDYIKANAKQLFGNQFWEARFLYRVDIGTKPEKTERRIMVLSKFRIFFISGKTPSKLHVEYSYPLLSITAVTLPNNSIEASLTIDNRRLFIRFIDENLSSHDFVVQLLTAFKHYYQNCDLHRYIDLSPSSLHSTYSQLPLAKPTLPCGGFRRTYASLCDFYKLTFRDEIVWDVEKIYSLHHNTVLRLDDFSHLSSKDLIPLIATLQFNSWFDGIASETQKLPAEVIDVIMLVLKKSQRIKELTLKNCGLKNEFLFSLSQSLLQNVNLPLQLLDLCGNTFDDHKAVGQLASTLSALSAFPNRINLDDCCLNAKSVTYLCDKIKIIGNETGKRGLLSLSLAGNAFKDDTIDMHSLLSYSPFLSYLNLSGTNFHLDKIWSPLKTCHQSLVTLLLSGCSFSSRKMSKDLNLLTSIKDFFSCAQKLTQIDLSDCVLPAEVLKYILLGLVCNQSSEWMSLNLSRSFADRQCISHLETCAPDLAVISKIILRDCALEQEAVTLLPALASMKNLKCLDVGGNNFATSKKQQSKYLRQILMELVKLIGEESSNLQELILSDCKIGVGLCVLINALGVAPCLKMLDISGNEITNFGARLLGKALQINSALEVLLIDRNQITHEGYADIAYALKSNNSLLSLPTPIQDVSESLKISKEKTEAVMNEVNIRFRTVQTFVDISLDEKYFKIELLLRRNNKSQGFNDCVEASSWIYQTHSKLVLGNVEEELNQAASKTNRLLLDFLVEEASSDVILAQKLMQDAEIAKDMLDKLVSLSENGENITQKMNDLADSLSSDLKVLLSDYTTSMVNYCTSQQLSIYQNANKEHMNAMKASCQQKSNEFDVHTYVNEFSRALRQRYNSVQFNMAASISEKICQEILKALNNVNISLAKVKKNSLSSLGGDRVSSTTPAYTPSGKKRFKFFGKRPLSIVEGQGMPMFADFVDDHISDEFRERAVLEGSTENCDSNSIELVNKEDFNVSTDDSLVIVEKAAHPSLTHIQKSRARPPTSRRARAAVPVVSNNNSSSTVDEGVDRFFSQTSAALSHVDGDNIDQPTTSTLLKPSDENDNKRSSRLPPNIPIFSPSFISELENKVLTPLVNNANGVKQDNSTSRHLTIETDEQKMRATSVKAPSPKVDKPSLSPIKAPTGEFNVDEILSLVDKNFGDQKPWLNYDTTASTSSDRTDPSACSPRTLTSTYASSKTSSSITTTATTSTPTTEKSSTKNTPARNSGSFPLIFPNPPEMEPKNEKPMSGDSPSSFVESINLTTEHATQPEVELRIPVNQQQAQNRRSSLNLSLILEKCNDYDDGDDVSSSNCDSKKNFDPSTLMTNSVFVNSNKVSNNETTSNQAFCRLLTPKMTTTTTTTKDQNGNSTPGFKESKNDKPPLPSRPPPPRPTNRFWEEQKNDDIASPAKIMLREKLDAGDQNSADQRKSVLEMRRVFEASKNALYSQQPSPGSEVVRPTPPPRFRASKQLSPTNSR